MYLITFAPGEVERVPSDMPVSWDPVRRTWSMPRDAENLARLQAAMDLPPGEGVRDARRRFRRIHVLRKTLAVQHLLTQDGVRETYREMAEYEGGTTDAGSRRRYRRHYEPDDDKSHHARKRGTHPA